MLRPAGQKIPLRAPLREMRTNYRAYPIQKVYTERIVCFPENFSCRPSKNFSSQTHFNLSLALQSVNPSRSRRLNPRGILIRRTLPPGFLGSLKLFHKISQWVHTVVTQLTVRSLLDFLVRKTATLLEAVIYTTLLPNFTIGTTPGDFFYGMWG